MAPVFRASTFEFSRAAAGAIDEWFLIAYSVSYYLS
jgi:hypothetical protein